MVVSSKGRYALRGMVELAAAPAGEYQPLARISSMSDNAIFYDPLLEQK